MEKQNYIRNLYPFYCIKILFKTSPSLFLVTIIIENVDYQNEDYPRAVSDFLNYRCPILHKSLCPITFLFKTRKNMQK